MGELHGESPLHSDVSGRRFSKVGLIGYVGGFLLIALLATFFCHPAVGAQASIRVAPKLTWRDSCPGVNAYTDAQSAASASLACANAGNPRPWAGMSPCPVNVINGEPNRYCAARGDGTERTVTAYNYGMHCPDDFKGGSTGWYSDSGEVIAWCELQKTTVDPLDGCPWCNWVGNPVEPSSGVKRQIEVDYESATNALRFERTIRSDAMAFAGSVHSSSFIDNSFAGVSPNNCLAYPYDIYIPSDGNGPSRSTYCFRLMGTTDVTTAHTTLWVDRGSLINFDLTSGSAVPNVNVNSQVRRLTAGPGDATWLVVLQSNQIDLYAADTRLLARIDASGNSITYTYSNASTPTSVAPRPGLLIRKSDAFGRSLEFRYDSFARMTRMFDPSGNVYLYVEDPTGRGCNASSCGRVLGAVYPTGFGKNYLYNETGLVSASAMPSPPLLTGIEEIWPASGSESLRAIRAGTYGYDDTGLARLTQQAGGVNKYVISPGTYATVVDPLGTTTTISASVAYGVAYPEGRSQAAGSGSAAAYDSLTYDVNRNVVMRTGFNGDRSCFAYTAGRNLRTIGLSGLTSATACPPDLVAYIPGGNGATQLPRKVSTEWHPDWRLPTRVAEPGRITTSIYNGQPDPFNANAIASCAPSTAQLPDGKPIAVLCKQVEQATTDTDGHLGFSAGLQSTVPNRTTSWTYNQYGQVLTEDGPRTDVSDITTYTYYSDTSFTGEGAAAQGHFIGDLQSVTNATGKVTSYSKYNKHGQVLESSDPNGVLSVNTYDLRQRLLSSAVGGQTTSYSYDAAGQLKKVTLPDASWVGYDYDDAHRQVAIYDNKGNRTEYVLDNAGNRTGETTKDPSGNLKRQLSRSIDALGRVQQTTGRESI